MSARPGYALGARALVFSVLVLAGATACSGDDDGPPASSTWTWDLPPDFPVPRVPADNPMSPAKFELGRRLFYDTRLSGNGTQSCASCHRQELAFTDGMANAVGSTGQVHRRSAMSLTNAAYNSVHTWANPLMTSLERQALVPMFGETPVELGLANREDEMLARLRADARYVELFADAFPDDRDPFTIERVTQAIACFERALVSGRSALDLYTSRIDQSLFSRSARNGSELFFSERLECHHCHGGFNFAVTVTFEGKEIEELSFTNDALYNVDGEGAYPARDIGAAEVTGNPEDMGRFRAPSLRNIALTAPYMHDGSIATLEEVIDHYARGGRVIESGDDAGDGSESPIKSVFLNGFTLTEAERADLIAFLESLTDPTFVTDPRFADPFASP